MKRRAFFWSAISIVVAPAPMRAPESTWAFISKLLMDRNLRVFTLAAGETVEAGEMLSLRPDGTVAAVRGWPKGAP